MRLHSTEDQKVSHPPSRWLLLLSQNVFSKNMEKKKENCLYIQTWAKLASKIAIVNNRTDQLRSSALGWRLSESVKHCTPPRSNKQTTKTTVTSLLEAGGTSLVAFMKKGVRVGGKVTRGWSEPCCEWWLHFPRGVFVGGRGELRLNSSKKKPKTKKTKKKTTSRFSRWHGEGAETVWATGDHRSWLAGWWNHGGCRGGCRCLLIWWLWCTGGLWVDGYVESPPHFSTVMPATEKEQWHVTVGQTLIGFNSCTSLTGTYLGSV